MKKSACLVIASVFFIITHSQTWQEWTQQKKTQIQYLLNQIAANKLYLDYIQKGYSIASAGLATINNIKDGDFNLYHDTIVKSFFRKPGVFSDGIVARVKFQTTRLIFYITRLFAAVKAAANHNYF